MSIFPPFFRHPIENVDIFTIENVDISHQVDDDFLFLIFFFLTDINVEIDSCAA